MNLKSLLGRANKCFVMYYFTKKKKKKEGEEERETIVLAHLILRVNDLRLTTD